MVLKRECKKLEPLLWAYVAGRLQEAENAKVQRHLNTCKDCREQADAYTQTVEGIAMLRVQPVPASLSNWQDVQCRLGAASPPVLARPSPLSTWRGIGAGIALAGAVCLLIGIVTTRNQGASAVKDTELAPLADNQQNQNGPKPFKAYERFAEQMAARLSDADLFGNKLKFTNYQENDRGTSNAPFTQAHRLVPASFLRAPRNRSYVAAERRRHHRYRQAFRSASRLVRDSEHNTSIVQPDQVVALSPEASALILREGTEREQPEYVLTTIVDSAPQPRDFVMDSMGAEPQRVGSRSYGALSSSLSCNTSDNANDKEIRGW